MTVRIVSSGVTSQGLVTSGLQNDGIYVESGGTIVGTQALGFSPVIVDGGVASSTYVSGLGELILWSGKAVGVTVDSGGALIVSSGAVAQDAEILSGGMLSAPTGATLQQVTVDAGGVAYLPGTFTVNSGKTFDIGPVGSDTVIIGAKLHAGALWVASCYEVHDGGVLNLTQPVNDGAVVISHGGIAVGSGEVDTADVMGLLSGATLYGAAHIASGGEARGVEVHFNFGGALNVDVGGLVDGNRIDAGAIERLAGVSIGDVVSSGGVISALSGGHLQSAMLLSGGVLSAGAGAVIDSLGAAIGARIIFGGATSFDAVHLDSTQHLVATSSGVSVGALGLAAGQDGLQYKLTSGFYTKQGDYFASQVVVSGARPDDFDGDSMGELVIQAGGIVVVGDLGAGGQLAYSAVGALGAEWSFRGEGDFLGDGHGQVLIQNTGGSLVLGELSGGQLAYQSVGALGPEWSVRATGDFYGDGRSDVVLQNTAGAVVVGETSGGQLGYRLVTALGPEWSFKGAGDFLGPYGPPGGGDQVLLENASGALVLGSVTSTGQPVYTTIGALGPEWTIEATGDFLAGGGDEFLMRNVQGAVVAGSVGFNLGGDFSTMPFIASYSLVAGLGAEWTFVGTGDYTGAGRDSVLLHDTANGVVATGSFASGSAQFIAVGALGSEWSFRG